MELYCVRVKNVPSVFVSLTYVGVFLTETEDEILLKEVVRSVEIPEMTQQGFSIRGTVIEEPVFRTIRIKKNDIAACEILKETENPTLFKLVDTYKTQSRAREAGLITPPQSNNQKPGMVTGKPLASV